VIHQVKQSKDAVERLNQVIAVQLRLLHLAADEPALDIRNMKANLDVDYKGAEEIANWVSNKKIDKATALINALNRFANHHDASEKRLFIRQIEADIELVSNPTSGMLQAVFDTDWKRAVGDFMKYFYAIFGDTFPEYLFSDNTRYSRQDFVRSFGHANPDLFLCSICDTVAYRTRDSQHTYTNVDHFFPQAQYPHLSIHPFNLVPICSLCNSGIKGQRDPLYGVTDITQLLLPYSNEPGLSEQAYIKVQPQSDMSNRDKHPLNLVFQHTKTFHSDTFIKNFDGLYRIEGRWNADIQQLEEHVFRRLTQFLLVDMQNGSFSRNSNHLAERLRLLMALVSTEDLGRDPFGYATVWYLHYLIDSLTNTAMCDKSSIYIALTDWATAHQKHLERLRTHAQELSDRIPQVNSAVNDP